MKYAVVLLTSEGVFGGRSGFRVVDAESPSEAVIAAHEFPPDYRVRQATVYPLAGGASIVPVEVDAPKWGKLREGN